MAGRRATFELFGRAVADSGAPRTGRLALANRDIILTPNFTAATSRGAIPHLTPDTIRKYIPVKSAYIGLEDFIEKKQPPIYQTPAIDGRRPLHSFMAFPSENTTILGPRRCAPVPAPIGSLAKCIQVYTSTGFFDLNVSDFCHAVIKLRPDIAVPLADVIPKGRTPTSKKLLRMVDRTDEWVGQFLKELGEDKLHELGTSIFAPVLPFELPLQWEYLRRLSEDEVDRLSGLAVYDTKILHELAGYPQLANLPRLSMDWPNTPQEILQQVSLGVDLFTLPFLNSVSEAGVALTFTFPPPSVDQVVLPLGEDLWSTENKALLSPLVPGCQCYTCSKHHRAFLHHLLNAGEMLAWNLLQIHNYHVIDAFFAGVRWTLEEANSSFEKNRADFISSYEPNLPIGSAGKPRIRGYNFKAVAHQEPPNKPAWNNLADQAQDVEATKDQ